MKFYFLPYSIEYTDHTPNVTMPTRIPKSGLLDRRPEFKSIRVDTAPYDDRHPQSVSKLSCDTVSKLGCDHVKQWNHYQIRQKNVGGRTSPLRQESH